MDISFIIVNWNTRQLLIECISSILQSVTEYQYEIFVVDNASQDGSTEAVRELFDEKVHILINRVNTGFAHANNQAISIAKGHYLVLLNSDTELRQGTIRGLVSFLDETPQAAMVGPRMVGQDGKVQNSFDNFPSLVTELFNKSIIRILFPEKYSGKATQTTRAFEVDSLIGACIAIRAQAVREVGIFDEDYFFFLEETDWCMRMRLAGWKIYHLPQVEVVHLQGQSKRQRPAHAWIEYYRSLYIFFRKHRSVTSYILLRVCRFLKLIVNLGLTVLGLCITFGMKRKLREKAKIYAHLLWWHLRLCPASVGLRNSD